MPDVNDGPPSKVLLDDLVAAIKGGWYGAQRDHAHFPTVLREALEQAALDLSVDFAAAMMANGQTLPAEWVPSEVLASYSAEMWEAKHIQALSVGADARWPIDR